MFDEPSQQDEWKDTQEYIKLTEDEKAVLIEKLKMQLKREQKAKWLYFLLALILITISPLAFFYFIYS